MLKTSLLLCAISFFCVTSTKGQVFGGNPPSQKFYQLNTDTIRIVFPKALEKQAREIAWLTHELAKNAPGSLGGKHRKYDVVLQNLTTESNAYVGIAPYRSEFFMMPELNNVSDGALPWHISLGIHEHRHIQQFSNFNKTIPKLLNVFLGQEGAALGMGTAIPNWFWEGDAVWQETVTTKQGRGRLPFFFNSYRSLWLGNKNYSYMKLRNGSLRHFVPNHYDLGYMLVSYGREQYGVDFWKKVTTDAVNYKGLIYPMQKAVKRHSGEKFKTFVKSSMNWYKNQMKIEENPAFQNLQPITKVKKNNVQFYQYPFVKEDGSLLVLKSDYRHIPAWFSIDTNGKEKKLRIKDISSASYYSFHQGKVVYTAYETDARWGWKDYSVLKIWDVESNTIQKITSQSRLFMPDIHAEAGIVVAANYSIDQKSSLQIVETNNTGKHTELQNPNNYLYTYPKFTSDAKNVIAAVRNQKGEMGLIETNIESNKETILIPFSNATLAYVQVYGDSILFTSSQKEGDVLFLFQKTNSQLSKLATLPNGNYQGSLDRATNSIVWNTFTADGTLLLKQPLQSLPIKMVGQLGTIPDLYLSAKTYAQQNLTEQVKELPGVVTRYKPAFKLMNIHSWRPTLTEPDYGITLFGENVLNTFSSEYSYFYNRNEGFHQIGATAVYGGWYPVIRAGITQTFNRADRINEDTTITWNQLNGNIGFSIPLNLTSGRTFKNFTLTASFNKERLSYTGVAKNFKSDEDFNYINTSVRWISQGQVARQHIFPRFAQSFSTQYRRTVNGKFGNQVLMNAALYLPGIHVNHNLVLFASAFARDTIQGSKFTNSFPFARGYNTINIPRMWRVSANYHFPVVYPEFGIGNIIYFMRVRANAFYDYTQGKSLRTGNRFLFRSAGTEIYFDTMIWNLFPASFGIRYSRLLDKDRIEVNRNPNQVEFVLPMNLF
jgi:hypothetical protein